MENQKYKSIFAVLLAAFLIVLILFFAVDVSNKLKIESKNTITLTGTGEVFAKPDLAQVSFSVVKEAKTVSQALEENAKKMNAVIDFIKNQGVEAKDLKTAAFNISPRYEWRESGQRVFMGYEVSQSLEVKIRDFGKIGSIIEGAAENGANQIGNLYFIVDDQDQLSAEARQKAIDEAKSKAKELALQLGVKLGRIVNFSEGGAWPVPYFAKAEAIGGGETPQIEPGENKISITVTITYEIR